MLEIEVKVPVTDLGSIETRLVGLGGVFVTEKAQEDLYMAHPCRDFGVTDEALRLRMDGNAQVLTYKGPKMDARSKTREEIEFSVPMEQMRTVLERLGFVKFIQVRKVRKEYVLDDVLVCLDQVEGLGSYVELEFSGQDAEKGLVRVEDIKHRLGIEGNEIRSYLELIIQKKGEM
ncbi:MAG: CYTH domain protein [Methanomassiliicoccales archaeon PtaU1.Bin124]|nr:MAG: CYTH domain protein [Methanomassiliicoccales archaeon PtaU1.Bin124]